MITGYEFFSNPGFGKALLLRKQGHLDAVAETLESQLREASPSDARSNTVFQRSEQFFPSIRKEIRERGGLTNPELLQEKNPAAVGHLLDALKRFDSLDPRRVMEMTFEVARLRGKPLTKTQDTEKSSCPPRCRRHSCCVFRFQLSGLPPSPPLSLPRRILLWSPAHLPHVGRIQTHRSRSRYRNGFERSLDYSFGVV